MYKLITNFFDLNIRYFTFDELCKTSVIKNGVIVDNRPDINSSNYPKIVFNIQTLAAILDQIRIAVERSIIVHSAFRSPYVNDCVGGVKNSLHLQGSACDFHVQGMEEKELENLVPHIKFYLKNYFKNYKKVPYIECYFKNGFIHMAFDLWKSK